MNYFLAFLAGVLSVGAFAPFQWWWLFFPAVGILAYLWEQSSHANSFRLGFCFGLGQFGVGVSWVYISIQQFGGMPPLLAGLCVFGFICTLSLYPALAGWFYRWTGKFDSAIRLGLFLPVIWITMEWVKSWFLTGMPWLNSGYAFLETPLSGLAPVGGVYLVGLFALSSVGIVIALIKKRDPAAFIVSLGCLLGWGAGLFLDGYHWTVPQGNRITVALIQNNVSLLEKWENDNRDTIIGEYLARSAEHRNKDLVVWPEGAIPDDLQNLAQAFWESLVGLPADVAFGAVHRPPPGHRYYNSLVAASDQVRIYNKQHLVPFGEFFPMQGLLNPILRHLTIPMADFSPWESPQMPLPLAGNLAAASICYEDAFPEVWRNQVPESGFLINVSEDMWFGNSLAPHQRLQMARFRAREAERPMVRSSNNGLSSLISWRGRITDRAPQFETAVVTGSIQPRTGTTPYIRYGDLVAMIAAVIMVLSGLWLKYLLARRRRL